MIKERRAKEAKGDNMDNYDESDPLFPMFIGFLVGVLVVGFIILTIYLKYIAQ